MLGFSQAEVGCARGERRAVVFGGADSTAQDDKALLFNRFEVRSELGSGGFGRVLHCVVRLSTILPACFPS